MNRRFFLTVVAGTGAGAALSSVGCGPPYSYVRKSLPSPLIGAQQVALEPVHFEGMRVGDLPEAVYLANKTPEQQASFQGDKQAFANRFLQWMSERAPIRIVIGPPPDPMTHILRLSVVHYEPGFFTFVLNRPTEVDARLDLVRVDGAVLEEIRLRSVIRPDGYGTNAASGTRMRQAGEQIGQFVAEYLQHRVRNQASAPRGRRFA